MPRYAICAPFSEDLEILADITALLTAPVLDWQSTVGFAAHVPFRTAALALQYQRFPTNEINPDPCEIFPSRIASLPYRRDRHRHLLLASREVERGTHNWHG